MKAIFFVVIGLVVLAVYVGVLSLTWPDAVFDHEALSGGEKIALLVLTVAVLGGYLLGFRRWGHKLPG